MAEQASPNAAKAQILNDRTYQEVEYLKKNLGPILVAALAEICIRRPADPIEYLGHWLLRWRYNEELKRRDVQNALEVVRQKAWTKDDENLQPNPNAPEQPPAPQTFTEGFVPGAPYAPPGYGGPLDQNVVEEATKPEGEAAPLPEGAEGAPPTDEAQAEPRKSGDAVPTGSGEQQQTLSEPVEGQPEGEGATAEAKTSPVAQEKRRSSQLGEKPGSGSAIPQEKRPSGEIEKTNSGEKRASVEQEKRASQEQERRASQTSKKSGDKVLEKQPSGEDANNAAPPAEEPAAPAE